jgi:hypothetical protein
MNVIYKNSILAKGSRALELWQNWQKATSDRAKAQKQLDDHMKAIEKTYKELHYGRI